MRGEFEWAQLESSPCFYRPDQPNPPPTPYGPDGGELTAVEVQTVETAVDHGAETTVAEAGVAEGMQRLSSRR